MNKFKIALCVIGTLLLSQNTIYAINIIFDLGGVLIGTNKSLIFRKTKPMSTIFFTITHLRSPQKALFKALDTVESFNTYQYPACDESGNPLPAIFCDYLAGVPSDQVLKRISETIGESGALWNLSRGIFDPTIFAESLYLIDDGVQLVQECVDKGYNVYILSNLDAESFEALKKQYTEFFDLFSGIVISGQCHLIKPDPAIYDHLINTYQLEKSESVFIDDQLVNIEAAVNCGIPAIHSTKMRFGKPNIGMVRTALDEWVDAHA